jgi:hypothetical protein
VADNDEESETGSEGEGNDHRGEDGGNMAFDKHWTHVVGKIRGEDAGDDETSDDEMGIEMEPSEKGSDEEQ